MRLESLEFVGFLNGKFNLEKEYPEKYKRLVDDLNKLDRMINWRKTSGISLKQRSFAEAIAKDLGMNDFDITKYDKKSISKFFDTYIEMWKQKKEGEKKEQPVDVPF